MSKAFEGMMKYLPGRNFIAEHDGRITGGMRIARWPDCKAVNLRMLPTILRASRNLGILKRFITKQNAWNKHDLETPHWHLKIIGITPDLQGNGIGKQMMSYYCDIVDKDCIEAYHETDRAENVPFYERFGFKVVGEEVINGAKCWYMLRPAKSD
jgi:ribosomal protein S18 acetylase RimI-like enzyme